MTSSNIKRLKPKLVKNKGKFSEVILDFTERAIRKDVVGVAFAILYKGSEIDTGIKTLTPAATAGLVGVVEVLKADIVNGMIKDRVK